VPALGVLQHKLSLSRLPDGCLLTLHHEAARLIVLEQPERVSSVNRQLHGDVKVIVAKALVQERGHRNSSADAMASTVRLNRALASKM
jgi:hypothetical protein